MKGAQVSHNVVVEVCENLPRCTSLLIRNFDLEEAVENRVCATFFSFKGALLGEGDVKHGTWSTLFADLELRFGGKNQP